MVKQREFEGKDPRASLWSPLPIWDDDADRWNLFHVAYHSAPGDGTRPGCRPDKTAGAGYRMRCRRIQIHRVRNLRIIPQHIAGGIGKLPVDRSRPIRSDTQRP